MSRTLPLEGIVTERQTYVEQVRPTLRARLIPLRASRRVYLGDAVSCEFENADTLMYQVQEMVIVEGVQSAAAVQHELDAYARLLPTRGSLSCTFFIEADDVATVRAELERLTGIQHGVSLRLLPAGEEPVVLAGVEVPGLDEDGPSTVTHAVHFLRFEFDEHARDLFRDPAVSAVLSVTHPEYAAEAPLAGDLRLALLADLAERH